ncbi:MAG: c-type cytochrome [Rubritalea sp.]|jgi:putative heme-binding domain-containing protein|tara:strand:+ start:8423 stop:11404 length:2982 start_codon:yes stop_codon:yes gene_type:complete
MKKTYFTSLISALSAASVFAGTTTVPTELETQIFSGTSMTPCPAVIAASPYGEVYVGVDLQGSVGKKPNMGYIAKLIDTDLDGKADKRTVFAEMDNPRGIISIGDRLIVLHSTQKNGTIETQQLSLYLDADRDGVADGPPKALVTNIGNPKYLKARGADHSTNNIRLGIDGWIYISIGDFGFVGAKGSDGKKLSMHGGGVVRVRPDGSELETFIHGTRNVYDVSIDPFMNVVTRENNNDGVGWWIRFSHYIQSGQYGYPSLYMNFPEDIIPALGEYGGGSGTGNLYFEEPGWPDKYNKTFMMTDWGRSHIYIHRVKKDGASFTDAPEKFIDSSQVTDIDVDGSGRMYISAWDGAGFTGNPDKGFVSIVTPKGWTYKKFQDLTKLNTEELLTRLKTPSSTARVYTQQEILRRSDQAILPHLVAISKDKIVSAESRVAALYTLAQLAGSNAQESLTKLSEDPLLKEHCVRLMADRLKFAKNADINFLKAALNDEEPRVQVAAAIALGRVGDLTVADTLIEIAAPPAKNIVTTLSTVDSTPSITGNQKFKIDVDTSTFKELYLIVLGDKDNTDVDVAWLNPTIHRRFDTADVTELEWESATEEKGKTFVNKTSAGKPLPNGAKGIATHVNSVIRFKKLPRWSNTFTATGVITNPSTKGSVKFIVSRSPDPNGADIIAKVHSTPNPKIILPHVAMQSLLSLNAEGACINALNSSDETMQRGAIAVMKFMHSEKVVDALISAAQTKKKTEMKALIADNLIRLHQKEVDYDGSTWWSTQPNPSGPYYYPVDWAGTEKISSFLNTVHAKLDADAKAEFVTKLKKNKAYVPELNPRPIQKKDLVKKVGKISIEDIILHVAKHKGNPKRGAKVIGKVGCAACHNIKPGEPIKGPDLTKLGHMKNADIAESIIKPQAVIAKSWVSITMKGGANHIGTLVNQNTKAITLHNIAGIPTILDPAQVTKIEPGPNMMLMHLCDNLSLEELSDLIGYIKSMDHSVKKK